MRADSLSRMWLSLGSAVLSLANPWRSDLVAVLSETTGFGSLEALRAKMRHTSEGRSILDGKEAIGKSIDLSHLRSLPESTFGRQYAEFMDARGFSPQDRNPVSLVQDQELAFVLQRYRESHDLWHVLTGMDTDVLGEVAQKWFEALQTNLPMCWMAALAGPARLAAAERKILTEQYIPWAWNCHWSARFLMEVRLENRFEQDLEQLRKDLGVIPAPRRILT